jgi:hypothetical protein
MPALPYEPPQRPESKNSARHAGIPIVAYRIVGLILLVLLVYRLCRTYTRLPAAQPIRYPAEYISAPSLDRFHVLRRRPDSGSGILAGNLP